MKRARMMDGVYAIGTFIVLLAVWQLLVSVLHVKSLFIPSPVDIARALVRGRGLYAANLLVTLGSTVAAFFFALVPAIALGTLISQVRFFERTLYPVLVAFQAMPRIALAPIIIVWFGFGPPSKIVLGAISAFFPIFLNTVHGMSTADPEQLALMRLLGASPMQVFWKVKLPNAMPFLLAGANIGIIFAILAVIVGEFLGANRGMGYLIVNESNQMDTASVFASIVLLSIVGLAFHYGLAALRRRLLFWSNVQDDAGQNI